MTNLSRVTGKIFGETASSSGNDPEIGQFGSAKAGTYNGTGDVATIQGLSAWSNGWIDAVTPSQQFPTLPEMTGFGKVLSYQTAYTLQKGVPEYDSGTTYYSGDMCKAIGEGKIFVSKIDNNINNPLTDTTKWEEVHFVNNKITNCILEAPNGVATYTTTSITIKEGLKVLLSDGRNADGTLKNIEYTFSEDTTFSILSEVADSRRELYLRYNNNSIELLAGKTNEFYISTTLPSSPASTNALVYNPETNIFTKKELDDWHTYPICIIGYITTSSNEYSDGIFNQPINILKRTDSSEISGWAMPSNTYDELTLGASGATYTAPANGWFYASAYLSTAGQMELDNSTIPMRVLCVSDNTGNRKVRLFIPAKKGDEIVIIYPNVTLTNKVLRFIYAEGSKGEG